MNNYPLILLVDDEEAITGISTPFLSRSGCQVLVHCSSRFLFFGFLIAMLSALVACGTLQVELAEPPLTPELVATSVKVSESPIPEPAATITSTQKDPQRPADAVAWYGAIHSVSDADPGYDYLKPWHLNILPKFGPAIGIAGADPTINAEIERLRDKDIKATFWGRLTCGVGDYGACQLLVTRLSADDGGPVYEPQRIEAWEGTIGRLLVQPGSQNETLYFVLPGEVPVLYGIASPDPAIQEELQRLPDTSAIIRIWGELRSKARSVTGTIIDVERLEYMGDMSPP